MKRYKIDLPGDWTYLSELGKQYIEEYKLGHGTSMENRSTKQIYLTNEIVKKSLPYLKMIASNLMNYSLEIINGKRIFVRNSQNSLEDLIHEGAIAIIEKIHNYKPEFSMSTFILLWAGQRMYRSSWNHGLIYCPSDFDKVFKMISESGNREEVINKISESNLYILSGEDIKSRDLVASAIYFSIIGEYIKIEDICRFNSNLKEEDLVSKSEEDLYLKEIDFEDPRDSLVEEIDFDKLKQELNGAFMRLSPKQKQILFIKIFGEEDRIKSVKKRFGISRQRAHKLYNESLERLRKEENLKRFI